MGAHVHRRVTECVHFNFCNKQVLHNVKQTWTYAAPAYLLVGKFCCNPRFHPRNKVEYGINMDNSNHNMIYTNAQRYRKIELRKARQSQGNVRTHCCAYVPLCISLSLNIAPVIVAFGVFTSLGW